jgi:hypothetical protein
MDKVRMRIVGYDDISHSLVVCFASDTTKSQDPMDYPAYAFQPLTMWPDVTDPNEIKKRIAMAGMHHAQMQEAKENFIADQQRVNAFKQMVGQVHEFTVNELTVVAHETPFQVV